MDHTIDITHDHGHYKAVVDGHFYGEFDTVTEAVKDIEQSFEEEEKAC